MGFFSALGKGALNFAKSTGNAANQMNKNLGQAARDINDAGGRLVRKKFLGMGNWALGNASGGASQSWTNPATQAVSNGITGAMSNYKPFAAVGRHFAGHNLFMHDQGNGYGMYVPGKGPNDKGNKGNSNGGGLRGGRSGAGGAGAAGSIYNLYHYNPVTTHYHGSVNNGTVNNVNAQGANIGNIGGQGGVGNLVHHLQNAYIDHHIQAFNPNERSVKPVTPTTTMLPPSQPKALSPGAPKALTAAYSDTYYDNGNFKPRARKSLPSSNFSPSSVDMPGIDPNAAVVGKPGINPNSAVVTRNSKPSQNMPTFNENIVKQQKNVNHVTSPGDTKMNQASLLVVKANQMLPYINEVYANEPYKVRKTLAWDAAAQFIKNAAETMEAPPVPETPAAPAMAAPTEKKNKTVGPDVLYPMVSNEVLMHHLDKADEAMPGFGGMDSAVQGQVTGDNGISSNTLTPFTRPKSLHDRSMKKKPKFQQAEVDADFHNWAETHLHPHLQELSQGIKGDMVPAGQVIKQHIDNQNKAISSVPDEPLPGMTGKEVPSNKQTLINNTLRRMMTGKDPEGKPLDNAQMDELMKTYLDSTPHLTEEQRLQGLNPAFHDRYGRVKQKRQQEDERASGVSGVKNYLAKNPIDGTAPQGDINDYEGNLEKSIDRKLQRDTEKAKFSPGNRMDAPIDNAEVTTDQEQGQGRQYLRDQNIDPSLFDKDKLRQQVDEIPEEKRRGNVDLDRGGKGIEPIVKKRVPGEAKDDDLGRAREIARGDENRRLNQENERDDSPLARSKSKNTGESGKSRKKHEASKLNELRIITAGMNSYEIEAVADGLMNLGYSVDQIIQIASDCEDINGSTSAVEEAAGEYWKPVPEEVKRGFH